MNGTILIHLQRNAMTLPDGGMIHFTRRWEATLLAMLLTHARANRDLSAETLQVELVRRGQPKPLNRAQHGRLIQSVSSALDAVPGCPVTLDYGPRKATVGPWRLRFNTPCQIEVDPGDDDSATASCQPKNSWAATPALETAVRLLAEPDLSILHKLLSTCLISDAFAADGNYGGAIESLQPVYSLPLTCDAYVMLILREALYQKRLGEFADARAMTLKALEIDPKNLLDPSLQHHARFFLDRIDYDESPGTAHIRLWELAVAPEALIGTDMRTAPEWHNLRALLARRRLLGIAVGDIRPRAGEDIGSLHRYALHHLETAIFRALMHKDWEKLQAFTANIAFHLQSVMPLGLSNVSQIFAWYALMMNYAEKLDAGKDSAWEYIFLGKFWLDHEPALREFSQQAHSLSDPFFIIQELHPAHEDFYLRAIERLRHCADARQVAIAWINYLRFARAYLEPAKVAAATKALCGLMDSTPALRSELETEGYGTHLPSQS